MDDQKLPDQTPPEGFEPQVPLAETQEPVIEERPPDLIADAEEISDEEAQGESGDADDGDDEAEDPDE